MTYQYNNAIVYRVFTNSKHKSYSWFFSHCNTRFRSGLLTGLIRNVSIPAAYPASCTTALSSPVKAAMYAGCHDALDFSSSLLLYSFSNCRIRRVASIPSITGIERSVWSVYFIRNRGGRLVRTNHDSSDAFRVSFVGFQGLQPIFSTHMVVFFPANLRYE